MLSDIYIGVNAMESKRLVETLKQIPFQILLLVVSGLIAVFVTMIPLLLTRAIAWVSSGSAFDSQVGIGTLITGLIGLVSSVIAMFMFMKKPGVDDAIVGNVYSDGAEVKFNPLYPVILIVVSVAVYSVLCWLVDFMFLSGPTQFIAPYIASFFGEVKQTAELADIELKYKLIAHGILILCEIPAMFIGYYKGFKARISGNNLV